MSSILPYPVKRVKKESRDSKKVLAFFIHRTYS
uniref:Uncharacterized protein n=1 Tax=Myoviridae sp. cthAo37 TaxID=2827701 RepID=A0A8S5S511_9CAUD|nr:MAG TPA: hypothetical protein [Myoviridae sp. cthAo37]